MAQIVDIYCHKQQGIIVLHNQDHAHRLPGDARSLGVSKHNTGYVFLAYFLLPKERSTACVKVIHID